MMPVNIRRLSRIRSACLLLLGARLVRTKRGMPANAVTPKACAAGQPSPPTMRGAWNQAMRSTSPSRSNPRRDLRAALYQHPSEPGLSQRRQPGREVDAALAARHRKQADARAGEGLEPLGGDAVAMDHPSRIGRGRRDQPGGQAGAQVTVHYEPHDRARAVARECGKSVGGHRRRRCRLLPPPHRAAHAARAPPRAPPGR